MKVQTIMRFLPRVLGVGMTVLFYACAQIVTPAGGPKDILPPRAMNYMPDSAATNFSTKDITIVFDEYIQLNDLQKQLTVSPPMIVPPEVKAKGKMLLIELKDTLKKNTTYSLNFGSSIRDFTEGNAKADFQYVFSTGSYIDTLTLTGTVKNAFDLKTDKGILVMLYETYDDSVPYKKLPSYFARTKEDGSYKINNIRPDTYKAFALKDVNANYLYDVPTENIAFPDSLITIKKNSSLDLFLFKENPKKQKIKKAYFAEHGHLVLAFEMPNKNSLTLNFLSQKPKENVLAEYSSNNDTLHYWFSDNLIDTMKIEISNEGKVLDTVRLKAITLEQAQTSSRGNKWTLVTILNVSKNKPFDFKKTITIKFNHPIKERKANEIKMTSGEKKIQYINTTDYLDGTFRNFFFQFPLNQDSSYQLFIPPATFTDIFGLTNDTIKLDFKTQEEKYYGTLKLTLKMKDGINHILRLMNETGEIFKEASSDKGIFSYTYLPPGSYKLRIIYDENGDGQWTTGDYLERKKPETVIYYPDAIIIRSNWDLELDWKME